MNTNKGSMIEVAIKALNEKGTAIPFADLWNIVKAELEITPEEEVVRIGHFYTDLSLSGQVLVLKGNVWDLTSRHSLEDRHFDTSDIYTAIDEKDDDETEAKEEQEYDQSVNGVVTGSDVEAETENTEEDGEQEKDRHARQEAAALVGED